MNKIFEYELVRKYPKLYKDYGGDKTQTAMYWGFTCGNGWFGIIDKLSEKLSSGYMPDIVAVQVKEKLGGLRFYINKVPSCDWDEVYNLITEAEGESYKTCELCGKPGNLKKGSWYSTTCNSCEKYIRTKSPEQLVSKVYTGYVFLKLYLRYIFLPKLYIFSWDTDSPYDKR